MTSDPRDPRSPGRPGADDRWVRDVLEDAVADVEPRDDLDVVRERVRTGRGRGARRWAAAGAGLAVAATVTAVAFGAGLLSGDDESAPPPAATPSRAASADATDTTEEPAEPSEPASQATKAPAATGPLPVYYLGDTPVGPRLFREFRAPFGREDLDRLSAAVDMAVAVRPDDPDYRTPWPAGTSASASYDGDLLTVDLHSDAADLRGRPPGASGEEGQLALQQLVYTAQAAVQDRAPVQFLLDGQATDRLLGEPAAEPVTEGDAMQVQAPVWIISPQDGTALSLPFTVEGRGAFFEANVSWQVLQGSKVVEDGFATAEECCTLAPYRFEIADLPPGDYVLRVYDADMSGGEGPGEHEDTKRFTVTG